ncbi:MAG: amidophosphoribosyltransferase, partial [Oscillospiraceae bacterium]|nr:amidophosphoribosyltransferase [Oscillospiraceae bacterium]
QRNIHNIQNTQFRTKFGHIFDEMKGCAAIGCINDSSPQPLLIRSNIGTYAICFVGIINNAEALIRQYLSFSGGHFDAMTGGKVNSTERVAALINQKSNFTEGIAFAQRSIEGTANILILTDEGKIIAARDKVGRIPVVLGKGQDGWCVSFESFACHKLGYTVERDLGPGEIVEITADEVTVLQQPGEKRKVCAFLWTYYGYPTTNYEGINVECMRCRNGEILARQDKERGMLPEIDYVGGVPDSGTPHAIGYANYSKIPFARPFIKYTPTWPRSFTPASERERSQIAKMKQVPVHELIQDKKLLFVDDSIVRGNQLRETVDFLYDNGAKEVHMRSACPPIMYGCKFLSFSRPTGDYDLISRVAILDLEGEEGFKYIDEYRNSNTERGKKLREYIAHELGFESIEFQTVEGACEAIGIPAEELCTYCWDGRE